ncbi:MAG: helix-hairpin-helix domain-containing protein [Labilithrix sp.]|nr:helix-hairpin-helix domain-containing protein [Labilithrix sp.]
MDLNRATEQELARIEAIGETLAKKIVEFRKRNGSFRSIDDLDKVEGFAQAQRDQIRRAVMVNNNR